MILKSIIIAALVAGLAVAAQKSFPGDDLDALCGGKLIKLQNLSELEALVGKLDTDRGAGCPDSIASALRDLHAVVMSNRFQECSTKAYENYRQFYMIYLDDSSREAMERRHKVHKSIRFFALAYGLTLAGVCRLNMINNLLHDDLKQVTKEDFERIEIKDHIAKNGSIAQALGYSGQRPDEMLLPDDFYSILDAGKETTQESRVSLKVVATAAIKRLRTVCQRRFAPVYKQVMLPVAKMANLGFDYRMNMLKHELKRALKDESTSDLVGKWTRVAFLCELVDSIQLIEGAEDAKRSKGNDANLVQVCTKDGKCHFEKPEGTDLLEAVEVDLDDIKPLEYEPNLQVDLRDRIYGSMSKAIAVSMVFTSFDERTNVRMRMAKKIMRNLKSLMMSYDLRKFYKEAKAIMKGVIDAKKRQKEPAKTDFSTDLVSRMNEMISRELNPERAVACEHCTGEKANPKAVWGIIIVIIIFVGVAATVMATKPGLMAAGFGAG